MFKSIDPYIHNQMLGRGVNILGYDPFWISRKTGRIKAEHFRLISEAGFNHVRINLHAFRFMGEAPDYIISPAWLDTLDWTVEQCIENGLQAILDMHEFTAIGKDPEGLKPKLSAFWRQISARYQNAPESVLFEILNEPNTELTNELWNKYLIEELGIIRETNPDRTVIIGPGFWNGKDFLHELELPDNDRNIITTIHYYHPMPFTHQGAPWNPENRNFSGITWTGQKGEIEAVRRDFAGIQDWAKEHDRPIYLGEFGAYEKADMNSRACYTAAIAREAEALGWSWGYWQFDSDFVVYDMEKQCWVEPILKALIPIKD